MSLAFFKPYQGKGAAFIVDAAPVTQDPSTGKKKGGCFYFKMMPERSDNPRHFDNSSSLVMKIGQADVGEILAVLTGRKDGAGTMKDGKRSGLFHKNASGNSALYLTQREDTEGYSIRISKNSDNDKRALGVNLTTGEACLLLEFIRGMMYVLFQDDRPEPNASNTDGGDQGEQAAPAPVVAKPAPTQQPAAATKAKNSSPF